MRVFLSGGTRTPWRLPIKKIVQNVEWFDPMDLPKDMPMSYYASEELLWLNKSDVVLFFFEQSNPSGIGSAFEVGYAVAKGKTVIFVDQKRTSHTEWLSAQCSFTFYDLDQAVEKLVELSHLSGGQNETIER